MSKTKKQHYIPQFYLRHFSSNKEKIFCIEKPEMKDRCVSIKDTAEENYFYDLNISKLYEMFNDEEKEEIEKGCFEDLGKRYSDLTKEEKDKLDQSIENYLADFIETPLSELFRTIIKNTYDFSPWVAQNCLFINEDEKHAMSYYLAVSYVRSKSHRDFLTKSFINMYETILPTIAHLSGYNVNKGDIKVSITKEAQKMNHINSILDNEGCSQIAGAFFSKKWVLFENLTDIKFVTCDNPFVIIPTEKPIYAFAGTGLSSPGVAIAYPISSRLLLMMYDGIKFSYIPDRCIKITKEESKIVDINLAIINNAHTYIYVEDQGMVQLVKEWSEFHSEIKEKCIKMLTSS